MISGNDCDGFFELVGRGWGIVVSAAGVVKKVCFLRWKRQKLDPKRNVILVFFRSCVLQKAGNGYDGLSRSREEESRITK